jgi:hypothetical protein
MAHAPYPQVPAGDREDPWRATFAEILRYLNRQENDNEGQQAEQAMELKELESRLQPFWAVSEGKVTIARALGLLVTNGMVQPATNAAYSWGRQRTVETRYQITAAGKVFLTKYMEDSGRIA